jgi:hypothetical protein
MPLAVLAFLEGDWEKGRQGGGIGTKTENRL